MQREGTFVHPSAIVDDGALIGDGTRIWHFSHVMAKATIGKLCTLGQNVFVASSARIGDRVKIQNNVSIYDGVVLEDDVFCGPSCVFTNVSNPRSEISRRHELQSTLVKRGATMGANATVVCGSTVGRFAMVGAGAVVARGEVPDYALMLGVPARRAGWVGRHGRALSEAMVCPESGWRYQREGETVRCLDWPEDKALEAKP